MHQVGASPPPRKGLNMSDYKDAEEMNEATRNEVSFLFNGLAGHLNRQYNYEMKLEREMWGVIENPGELLLVASVSNIPFMDALVFAGLSVPGDAITIEARRNEGVRGYFVTVKRIAQDEVETKLADLRKKGWSINEGNAA